MLHDREELLRLLPALKKMGVRIVALTRDRANPLARAAHLVVPIGNVEEACPMGLTPTASTTRSAARASPLLNCTPSGSRPLS